KAFGGQGSFLAYTSSYSLISIPGGILSLALSVIPCIGSIAGLAGGVDRVVLLIFMTMGVHRLSGSKATASRRDPAGCRSLCGVYCLDLLADPYYTNRQRAPLA